MIIPKLVGPFVELVTMDKLPLKGPVKDSELEILHNAALITAGDTILEVGKFDSLLKRAEKEDYKVEIIQGDHVGMPGFIDPHTHICWAGSRANDYLLRLQGKTYTEIASAGGGIWDTVTQTRKATLQSLEEQTALRAERHLFDGVTTLEVKSGYGLTIEDELKMLQAIRNADERTVADLIPTCLAAHICPKDFEGSPDEYLAMLINDLLPKVREKNLAERIDIYIDKNAFSSEEARIYLDMARALGFDICVHGDQFTEGGSREAVYADAVSVDHLEVSGEKEIRMVAESNVIPVVLPGSSIGLGLGFAPARKLLDAGASLAIGSDWNPGSAPMGDLLLQASVLGIYEKLSMAEILTGISFRAAAALKLNDRGVLSSGKKADFIAFNLNDYREIIYNQGKIKPSKIWKNGKKINKFD
jgi:imidazolonepropionase